MTDEKRCTNYTLKDRLVSSSGKPSSQGSSALTQTVMTVIYTHIRSDCEDSAFETNTNASADNSDRNASFNSSKSTLMTITIVSEIVIILTILMRTTISVIILTTEMIIPTIILTIVIISIMVAMIAIIIQVIITLIIVFTILTHCVTRDPESPIALNKSLLKYYNIVIANTLKDTIDN